MNPKKNSTIKSIGSMLSANKLPLIGTLLFVVAYYIYAQFSNGFYQHDEAAHFVNMKGFWHNPHSVLGNWAKPGYKLIYAIPALFGEQMVVLTNCIFAAFTSFLVYKILELRNSKYAYLGFLLLAFQPLWIQLSSRNYSELISAFLLALAVYLHYRKSFNWAIFVLSYITLIRQELYPIVALYGLYLLVNKKYLSVVYALIPQVLITVWAFLKSGSLMYIYNSVIGTSEAIADAYPRQGFDHYFLMSQIIFGAIALTLALAFLWIKILKKDFKDWAVVLPALLFFLLHCLFNSQTLEFGPASGGNLRYIIIISPLIAIMGAQLFDDLKDFDKRYLMLIVLIPLAIVVGTTMSFEHNNIKYSDVKDYTPLYFVLLSSAVILIPLKKKSNQIVLAAIIVLMFFQSVAMLKPYKLSNEDKTMKRVAEWYEKELKPNNKNAYFGEKDQVFASHVLFNYYQGKSKFDFEKPLERISSTALDTAAIGSVIIWESHYSYRPKLRKTSLHFQYFLDRPFEYTNIKNFAKDRFSVKVFVKTNNPDENFNAGKKSFDAKKYDEALESFTKVVKINPDNYMALYYCGQCYQNKRDLNKALQYYSESLEINKNFGKAYYARGSVYLNGRKPDLAITEFNKALQFESNNATYHFMKGNAYFSKQAYKEASTSYIAAINLNKRFATAYHNLGLCQIRQNNNTAGCTNLKNALKLGFKQAQKSIDQYCK